MVWVCIMFDDDLSFSRIWRADLQAAKPTSQWWAKYHVHPDQATKSITQTIHVWYIFCLPLVDLYGKCRLNIPCMDGITVIFPT